MILVDRIDLGARHASLEVWDEAWPCPEPRVAALVAPARALQLDALHLQCGVLGERVGLADDPRPATRTVEPWPLLAHRGARTGAGVRYTAQLAHRPDAHRGIAPYAELLLRAADMPAVDLVLVRLVTYELCVNAIEHGKPLAADPTLEIGFEIDAGAIRGWMRDACEPFDPTVFRSNTFERLAGDRKRRGWGLRMVRRIASEIEHSHDGHGNRVFFTKELTHEAAT
jgi:anti-sigma regulatory factor (Ser/Thr protein kinase)